MANTPVRDADKRRRTKIVALFN